MSPESIAPAISSYFVQLFVEPALQEVGAENLPRVLEKSNLSPLVIEKDSLEDSNGIQAAELYALLQQALRHFYGRGVRGILLRIGYGIWERITRRANILEKAELEVVRRLPVPARRRRVLELVAGLFRDGGGVASIHTLDLDYC